MNVSVVTKWEIKVQVWSENAVLRSAVQCPVLHHHPQAEDTVRCPPNRKPLIAQRRDPGAAGVAPSAARAPATRPALIARGPAAPRLPRCAIYIYIYYIYSYPSSRR
ncbi:hypothetical protein EVAR_53653_1 [Eumeta japonica]|uniref:Uncharacterized protein n=1 Tax=Eumeta variegata TaxID=151549 RepID=A0A4C1YJT0_EUMVA|nr:hypothetical protein EVAR_53653_1 [Eumeta japonica]